jgi:hypothetical protein
MSVSTPPCALLPPSLPPSLPPHLLFSLVRLRFASPPPPPPPSLASLARPFAVSVAEAVIAGRREFVGKSSKERRRPLSLLRPPSLLFSLYWGNRSPGPGKIIIRATGTGRAREPSRPINYARASPRGLLLKWHSIPLAGGYCCARRYVGRNSLSARRGAASICDPFSADDGRDR